MTRRSNAQTVSAPTTMPTTNTPTTCAIARECTGSRGAGGRVVHLLFRDGRSRAARSPSVHVVAEVRPPRLLTFAVMRRGGETGMRMHRFARPAAIAAVGLVFVAAACSNTSSPGTAGGSTSGGFQGAALNGAGSTFAAPLYQLWSQSFLQKEPDAQINYQAIGSGGGI